MQNAPIDKFTALMGTTFVTISMFMSRGHFPANFGQLMDSFWTTRGQPLGNFGAQKRAKTDDKKPAQKLETLTFLNFWSRSEGLLFFAEFFFELTPGVWNAA